MSAARRILPPLCAVAAAAAALSVACSILPDDMKRMWNKETERAKSDLDGLQTNFQRDFFQGNTVGRRLDQSWDGLRERGAVETYYLGRGTAARMLAGGATPRDSHKLQQYVNQIGQAILAANDDIPATYGGYRFIVIEGDEVQAASAPGGFVFLWSGAVALAADEDELAALIAHEIAHVAHGHGLDVVREHHMKTFVTTMSLTTAQVLAGLAVGEGQPQLQSDLAGATDALREMSEELVDWLLLEPHDRALELDADRAAAVYLERAGYDPQALKDFLARLPKHDPGATGWARTHPSPQERIGALSVTPYPEHRAARAARFAASMPSAASK
jgi:predicted Zn-dependent protease